MKCMCLLLEPRLCSPPYHCSEKLESWPASRRGKNPPMGGAAAATVTESTNSMLGIRQALLLYPVYTVISPISRILFIQTPPLHFLFILL